MGGQIWTVPFHEAKPREMEQSKFVLAIIFLPLIPLKPLIYIFVYISDRVSANQDKEPARGVFL